MAINKRRIVGVLLFVSLLCGAPARSQTAFGTLSNFDVFNTTGEDCYGFEIEFHGARPEDIRGTFGAPFSRYGDPQVTATQAGALVRYAARWD